MHRELHRCPNTIRLYQYPFTTRPHKLMRVSRPKIHLTLKYVHVVVLEKLLREDEPRGFSKDAHATERNANLRSPHALLVMRQQRRPVQKCREWQTGRRIVSE